MWKKIKDLLFHNQSVRQTVAKNTFWLAISNVGGRLLRAVVIIYSARVLGAAEWGVFSYATSLVGFITVFADIGISPILVRETVKLKENPLGLRQILSTSFFMKLILFFFGALSVIFIAPHITTVEGVKPLLPIVIFILAFDTMREFGFSLIRAMEKMEVEAALYLTTNAAIVIFGFIFLHFSKSVVYFTYAYAFGTGIGMIVTIWTLRKKFGGIFSNFSARLLRSILTSAWPIAISSFLGILMLNTDILIIGWLGSAEDVGLYSAAQRIIQMLYLMPAIVVVSLLPVFSRLAGEENRKKMSLAVEKVLSIVYLFAIPVALGSVILGKEIINFVFGSGYTHAISSFRVLGLTMLVDFPTGILSGMVFAYNNQKKLTIYSIIGGFSNVIFDLILIPRFGIVGSAFATLSAQTISNIYLHWTAKRLNNFNVLPHLKKIFVASAVMSVVVLLVNFTGLHVLISIAVGTAVYFGTLFILREPVLKEMRSILQSSSLTGQASGEQIAG